MTLIHKQEIIYFTGRDIWLKRGTREWVFLTKDTIFLLTLYFCFSFTDSTASIIARRRRFNHLTQELYELPIVVWDGGEPSLSGTSTLTLRVCPCQRHGRIRMCQGEAFLSSAGLSTGALIAILLCIVILLGKLGQPLWGFRQGGAARGQIYGGHGWRRWTIEVQGRVGGFEKLWQGQRMKRRVRTQVESGMRVERVRRKGRACEGQKRRRAHKEEFRRKVTKKEMGRTKTVKGERNDDCRVNTRRERRCVQLTGYYEWRCATWRRELF